MKTREKIAIIIAIVMIVAIVVIVITGAMHYCYSQGENPALYYEYKKVAEAEIFIVDKCASICTYHDVNKCEVISAKRPYDWAIKITTYFEVEAYDGTKWYGFIPDNKNCPQDIAWWTNFHPDELVWVRDDDVVVLP